MKQFSRTVLAILMFTVAVSGALASGNPDRDYRDPKQLEALIEKQTEPYILIDVRTAGEYKSGFIPTAVNIPYTDIAGKLPTDDRETLVIVYCQSGRRSGNAFLTLTDLGFHRVVDFGGITNWRGDLVRP